MKFLQKNFVLSLFILNCVALPLVVAMDVSTLGNSDALKKSLVTFSEDEVPAVLQKYLQPKKRSVLSIIPGTVLPEDKPQTVVDLNDDCRILLAQTYGYFLNILGVKKDSDSRLEVTTLDALKAEYAKATFTPEELGEIFVLATKKLMNQGLFYYEGDSLIVNGLRSLALDIKVEKKLKDIRYQVRTKRDPAHKIAQTLRTFLPLILIPVVKNTMKSMIGEYYTQLLEYLSLVGMVFVVTHKDALVTKILKCNPLVQAVPRVMDLVHRGLDRFVSKGQANTSRWRIASFGAAFVSYIYVLWSVVPFVYNVVKAFILFGISVPGRLYEMSTDLYGAMKMHLSEEVLEL